MVVTAAMVKELREMTGAGMMDCKKALSETDGNMDEAVEYLRKHGQAKAEKKAGRIAAEGLCRIACKDEKTAAVVEVNSETDFVAKNEDFQKYVETVAVQAVNSDAADIDAFLAETWAEDSSKTVKEALVDKIAVIGEKLRGYLTLRDIVKVPATLDTQYAGSNMYIAAIRNTAGILIITPLIFIYCFAQKYLVQGIERSGLTAE